MIPGVLRGLNATIFAYGATGSGKTHSMVGTPTDPGLMVLSMNDIFAHMVRGSTPSSGHMPKAPLVPWASWCCSQLDSLPQEHRTFQLMPPVTMP